MNLIFKLVHSMTTITKWIAAYSLLAMTLFITYAVIARTLGHPALGDVEIVQLIMVLLIMFSLAYTETIDGHIAIGLVVDQLPHRFQLIFDFLARILTVVFCFLFAWVFFAGLGSSATSDLLRISFYPFKLLIIIGFSLWGLEALLKAVQSLKKPMIE